MPKKKWGLSRWALCYLLPYFYTAVGVLEWYFMRSLPLVGWTCFWNHWIFLTSKAFFIANFPEYMKYFHCWNLACVAPPFRWITLSRETLSKSGGVTRERLSHAKAAPCGCSPVSFNYYNKDHRHDDKLWCYDQDIDDNGKVATNDERLETLETWASFNFTIVNLPYQLSWLIQITLCMLINKIKPEVHDDWANNGDDDDNNDWKWFEPIYDRLSVVWSSEWV